LELLVEEASMEAFLGELLPAFLPDGTSFHIHAFQGKTDLLDKLPERLRGYAGWLPAQWRIVVMVDQDDDDCHQLKARLEQAAADAGLLSRSAAGSGDWTLVNRISVEELEAWYFGDWPAVRAAYPRARATIPQQSRYRNPDAIAGGTWEAFERELKKAGYFKTGLLKLEAARTIGRHVDPQRNRSKSFQALWEALAEAVGPARLATR
jgi:hypothetical protein